MQTNTCKSCWITGTSSSCTAWGCIARSNPLNKHTTSVGSMPGQGDTTKERQQGATICVAAQPKFWNAPSSAIVAAYWRRSCWCSKECRGAKKLYTALIWLEKKGDFKSISALGRLHQTKKYDPVRNDFHIELQTFYLFNYCQRTKVLSYPVNTFSSTTHAIPNEFMHIPSTFGLLCCCKTGTYKAYYWIEKLQPQDITCNTILKE